MVYSLTAFMDGLIDYAGLFPPARLPLDIAIRNYADYRSQKDAGMLSRFIIPAERLKDLAPYAEELFDEGSPYAFSVLGKGTETIDDFLAEIDVVIDHCRTFNEKHHKAVTTEIMEIKLPKEAAFSGDAELIKSLLNKVAQKLGSSPIVPHHVFYEGYLEESWKKDIEAIIEAIGRHNLEIRNSQDHFSYSGYKQRCGGVEAYMFPSIPQLAYALNTARNHNVALKCTAGLHHPVRHYSDDVQTKMHGFFNVFGGAMLAWAHDLNDEELQQILEEEDPEQFHFTDEAMRWRDYSIFTGEISELREVALTSFGSCSFEEPVEDLQKLKLLNYE